MSPFEYVPILKLKMGEVTALNSLKENQKERLLPLFEVVFSGPRKDAAKKDRDTRLASIIDKFLKQKLPEFPNWLHEARGKHPFILDFNLIYVDSVREIAIEHLLSKCAENQQNVIVSVNLADSNEYKTLVYGYLKKYGYGLCIRVSRTDLSNVPKLEQELADIVADSGLSTSQIDLLIDIKEENDDQKYTEYFNTAQQLSTLQDWRNIIFANGAFPETMGIFKSGKEHDQSRTDWIRYNAAIANEGLSRKPIYSDYSVRYPIYDPESEKHSPSPTIKYTTESNWRIMKGAGYDYGHYFVYSLALVSGSTYYGVDHCYGDKIIKEKADKCQSYLEKRAKKGGKLRAKGAGTPEEWIGVTVAHHTVVTLAQLSSQS